MNADCKKLAFTLVELMVAMVSSAIVILAVSSMLLLALRAWNTNNAYVRLRRDTAFAIEQMAGDIRMSNSNTVTVAVNNRLNVISSKYTADFVRNPANNVISYSRDGTVTDPFLARNVTVFNTAKTNNGVQVTLVMVDARSGVAFTNSTRIYQRN